MTMKHLFLLFLTASLQQISYGFLQVSTPLKHGGNLPSTVSSTIMMAASTLVQRSNLKDGDQAMKEQDSLVAIPPRPLEQNWWPVVALTALDSSRPNAIKVLGKDLVIFKSDSTLEDDDSSSWTVLDDRCSHRFAPLSEGRVIPLSSNQNSEQEEEIENCSSGDGGSCGIQCAYHGWEFDSTGTCAKVPQDPSKTNKARSIQTYPCRVAAGMVWIWSDPDTYSTIGRDIALPINPLLQKVVEQFGPASCYMRDLPYGMEILGENLLDLSHLPYAHHSVGSLTRSLGQALPTKMMSQNEREDYAKWEADVGRNNNKDDVTDSPSHTPVVPLYQAKIVDAAKHDPILIGLANQVKNETLTQDWETTISFFDPCHVRYRRTRGPGIGLSSHVELFLCPTSESRSRVFLFNIMGSLVKEDHKEDLENEKADKTFVIQKLVPIIQRLQRAMKPSSWKTAFLRRMIRKNVPFGHGFAHQIFDGDGIFLHYQGNRMKAADLTFRDYSTPSSCDVLLNAYRRFLDSAARNTPDKQISSAVVGTGMYGQDLLRSEMLDRYNTHTKHCPDCLRALQRTRQARARNDIATTALIGSAGASTVISVLSSLAPARRLTLLSAGVGGALWVAVKLLLLREKKLAKKVQSFLFEDYVHADKD